MALCVLIATLKHGLHCGNLDLNRDICDLHVATLVKLGLKNLSIERFT